MPGADLNTMGGDVKSSGLCVAGWHRNRWVDCEIDC